MKIKLFQLAMTFVAVIALASPGITGIQYFEDFEGYDEGYDIRNEVAWNTPYKGTPFVDSGVSMPTLAGAPGNKSLTTEPSGDGDYGMFFYFQELGHPLTETSVLGFWAMRGPGGYGHESSEVIYIRYQDTGATGIEYGLMSEGDLFKYRALDPWADTGIPCELNTWYRVMWVATGTSVDLYVADANGDNDTLLHSCTAITNLSTLNLLFIRRDTRIDNVFIADSKLDIDVISAVESAGKLTSTWGRIKAE